MTEARSVTEFRARFGVPGEVERRSFAHAEPVSVRASGDPASLFGVAGHAVVFRSADGQPAWSLDLGGFRERILPTALDDVLASKPDVALLHEHNAERIMARVGNGTLSMRVDERGLAYKAKVQRDLSYARDVEAALRTGLLSQMSFAMSGIEDTWSVASDGTVERTISRIGTLHELSVVAAPAYPQTDAALQDYFRSLAGEHGAVFNRELANLKVRARLAAAQLSV